MENVLVSNYGEWYYTLLIAVFSTFFGFLSIKLGDTLAAIREIAINSRSIKDEEHAAVEYEETYPRLLNVKGLIYSTKGVFSIIGLTLIIVGWIPMAMKIKQLLGF